MTFEVIPENTTRTGIHQERYIKLPETAMEDVVTDELFCNRQKLHGSA